MEVPPTDGDRPPRGGDGDGPRPRPRPQLPSSTTLIAAVIALIVALIAVLLGIVPSQQPSPSPSAPRPGIAPNGEPILQRIDYNDLVRLVRPYLPLYRDGLPPFERKNLATSIFNRTIEGEGSDSADGSSTVIPRLRMLADTAGRNLTINGVPTGERTHGEFAMTGKVSFRNSDEDCTGALVWPNVIVTADHCLPWERPDRDWDTITFTPAFDGFAETKAPYGTIKVESCVGIKPVFRDGRDMAACKLGSTIGYNAGYAGLDIWPDGPDTAQDFYETPEWYTVGYSSTFKEAKSQAQFGRFKVGNVRYDESNDCSLFGTDFFANKGWSGGPVFIYPSPDGKVHIGGIVRGCDGPDRGQRNCVGATVTEFVGGYRLSALATLAIAKWDVNWGYNRSPNDVLRDPAT